MLVLWENGEMNISKIGEYLHLDNGTLTPLLKRMEKNRLLSRTRSMDDERVVLINLTEDGKMLKEQAKHIPEAVQSCFHLNEEKKKELMSALDEILLAQNQSAI